MLQPEFLAIKEKNYIKKVILKEVQDAKKRFWATDYPILCFQSQNGLVFTHLAIQDFPQFLHRLAETENFIAFADKAQDTHCAIICFITET